MGDGTNVRDYIYIDDVCQMLIMLLEYEGEFDTFNLSSNSGNDFEMELSKYLFPIPIDQRYTLKDMDE